MKQQIMRCNVVKKWQPCRPPKKGEQALSQANPEEGNSITRFCRFESGSISGQLASNRETVDWKSVVARLKFTCPGYRLTRTSNSKTLSRGGGANSCTIAPQQDNEIPAQTHQPGQLL